MLWCVGEPPPETRWASPSPPTSLDWEGRLASLAPSGLWSAASPDPARTGAPLLVGLPLLKPNDGGAAVLGALGAEGAEAAEGADAFSGVPTGGTTRSCPSADRRAAREVGDSPGLKRGDEGSMVMRVGLAGRVGGALGLLQALGSVVGGVLCEVCGGRAGGSEGGMSMRSRCFRCYF